MCFVLLKENAELHNVDLDWHVTARNLYQLNASEVPLTLHYGFEGRIIILHENPYRWSLQNDAKCYYSKREKVYIRIFKKNRTRCHKLKAETVGNIVIYYLKMTLMLIKNSFKKAFKLRAVVRIYIFHA